MLEERGGIGVCKVRVDIGLRSTMYVDVNTTSCVEIHSQLWHCLALLRTARIPFAPAQLSPLLVRRRSGRAARLARARAKVMGHHEAREGREERRPEAEETTVRAAQRAGAVYAS